MLPRSQEKATRCRIDSALKLVYRTKRRADSAVSLSHIVGLWEVDRHYLERRFLGHFDGLPTNQPSGLFGSVGGQKHPGHVHAD
jgi:hypothetical protein